MEKEKTPKPKKVAAPKISRVPRVRKVKDESADVAAAPVAEMTVDAGKDGAYLFAIGRRKTSVALVRVIKNGKGLITVNGKPMESYFTTFETRNAITSPLKMAGQENAVDVSAQVKGGGMRGQSESVRLGIARALTELNPVFRKTLKKLGYLTRDPRAKERKKPGLKRARRAPQWSKR